MRLRLPSQRTLDKYGLTLAQWVCIAAEQNMVCAICKQHRNLNVDHRHVKGFKKMPAEQKRQYVRGLLCFYCNRYLVAKNDVTTIDWVKEYLR